MPALILHRWLPMRAPLVLRTPHASRRTAARLALAPHAIALAMLALALGACSDREAPTSPDTPPFVAGCPSCNFVGDRFVRVTGTVRDSTGAPWVGNGDVVVSITAQSPIDCSDYLGGGVGVLSPTGAYDVEVSSWSPPQVPSTERCLFVRVSDRETGENLLRLSVGNVPVGSVGEAPVRQIDLRVPRRQP